MTAIKDINDAVKWTTVTNTTLDEITKAAGGYENLTLQQTEQMLNMTQPLKTFLPEVKERNPRLFYDLLDHELKIKHTQLKLKKEGK